MSVYGLTLDQLDDAARLVDEFVPPTPQHRWPLIEEALGTEAWLKHENHTSLGAFKMRGGIVYLHRLMERERPTALVTATRGNHGQAIGAAARRYGIPLTIVVPHGNSREKNEAMRAAEGAGAAALAAAMHERAALAGQRVGIIVTGANVDRDVFARTLS